MTRAVKHDGQGKGRVLKRPQSGELTCSEGQVEDMLSAGESTEEEPIRPPSYPNKSGRLGTRSRRFAKDRMRAHNGDS